MEKKKIVISSITVAVLLVLVVASSYAYFAARIQSSGLTSTSVGAKTLDSFAINTGSDISLIANQDNFALGKGNLSSSTTATVTFTARNDEASSYTYYAGFYISLNEFFYSSTTDTEQFDADGYSYGKAILSYSDYPSYNLLPDFDDAGWVKSSDSSSFERTTYYGQNAISGLRGGLTYILKNTNNNPYIDCYVKYVGDYNGAAYDLLNPGVSYTLSGGIYAGQSGNLGDDGYMDFELLSDENLFHWWFDLSKTDTGKYVTEWEMSLGTYNDRIFYAPICVDKNTTEGANFDINDYYKYVDPVPELELTIKKNGEILVDSYDITGFYDGYINILPTKEYTDKANQDFDALYWDVLMPSYSSCMTNYYPTFGNYFDESWQEINGGYDAFVEEICGDDSSCIDKYNYRNDICWPGYQIVSSEAGKTTTDTWEAIVTFKNLDGNQNINIGKAFEGYFYFNSRKDYSSDEIMQFNFEKCVQKWYPSFDYETDYDTADDYNTFVSETCNGDEECQNQIVNRTGICHTLWWY